MVAPVSLNLWPLGLSRWLPGFAAGECSPYNNYEGSTEGGSQNTCSHSSHDSNQRTRNQFRPRAPGKGGATSYQLRQYAEATLGGGSLRKVVKLPEGEDENEWLAVNSMCGLYPSSGLKHTVGDEVLTVLVTLVVDFYNQINLLYGAITEFCSPQSCPEMKATDEFEYLWQDTENYKRPTKMPAPAYIEQLMSWVQSNIDNEAVLPSRIGVYSPALVLSDGRSLGSYNANVSDCRRALPQVLPGVGSSNIQAHVSCLRPYLLPPLPCDSRVGPGAASQHKL